MAKGPLKVAYLNVRMPQDVVDQVDRAIRETQYVKDTDGLRSEYVRDAASMRARAETGYLAGHLGALIERYAQIVERHRPELTYDEWNILIATTQSGLGYVPGHERHAGMLLFARVLEYLKLDASEAGDNPLTRKIPDWGYAGTVAVLDFCERYWAAQARGEEPPPLPVEKPVAPAPAPAKPRKR